VSSYCPRSSLPAKVLAWLSRPPGPPDPTPPARTGRHTAAGVGGPRGRRRRGAAGRVVVPARRPHGGISKTEVGDSLDLLLGELAALGLCQPDGTFITTLGELGERLAEMAHAGEAVCMDGLATRVQRPRGWANQKVLYDAKRHAHTAQGVAVSTVHGDLLWVDGAGLAAATSRSCWRCRGWTRCWTASRSPACWTGGFGAWPGRASTGTRRSGPAHQRPPHRRAARLQPPAGGAARAGGAVDRPSCQRLGAAPLARAAVPDAGRLPGRRRAGLPQPLAPSRPR
jgi:hypothetical protein